MRCRPRSGCRSGDAREAAQAPVLDWSLEVEGARLRCCASCSTSRRHARTPDEAALDRQRPALVRGWARGGRGRACRGETPGRAAALAARFAEAFPLAYRTDYGPAEAARRHPAPACARRRAAGRPRARRAAALPGELCRRASYGSSSTSGMARCRCPTRCRCWRTSASAWWARCRRCSTDGRARRDPRLPARPARRPPGRRAARARRRRSSRRSPRVLNGAAEDDAFNRLITAAGARRARGRTGCAPGTAICARPGMTYTASAPWSMRCCARRR